jgi:hypothetical protein
MRGLSSTTVDWHNLLGWPSIEATRAQSRFSDGAMFDQGRHLSPDYGCSRHTNARESDLKVPPSTMHRGDNGAR